MPALINLKTNLKSLGYGNDRPDGGSSNQPYIVTPIPDGEALNSPDFLLRNGYLNPVNSYKDTERLLKYFTDIKTPSGLLFTAKQELLERQNPKLVNINRVYNPFSTIFQASLLSIGEHLNKQGIDPNEPSYYLGGTYGYFSATRGLGAYPIFQTLSNGDIENRLTIAYTAKIAKQDLGGLTINPFGITRISGDNILLSYPGGPGSILGIGLTNIRIQNPTQTRKSAWSYKQSLEEETFPSDISFKPVYISATPDIKGYLTPSGKKPSIEWVYNFALDQNTVSALALKSSPTDENYNTLYIRGADTTTDSTPGGTPDYNIADNLNIGRTGSVGVEGRFTYAFNVTDGVDNYLVPKGSLPSDIPVPYKYGSSEQYTGLYSEFLTDDENLKLIPGNQDENIARDLTPSSIDVNNNSFTFSYRQTLEQPSKGVNKSTNLVSVKDFRQSIKDDVANEGAKENLISSNYKEFNREATYGASKTIYRGNYKDGKYILNPNEAISEDQTELGTEGEDIIDFNFNIDDPNSSEPNRLVDFRAYLETWNDGAKAEWSPIKYMGRAESFYKYNGFSRDANVTFLVPALSRADMITNYKKLNALFWTVAPSYSPTTKDSTVAGLMRGSVTKFTMGNYFRGMPCIIKSLDFSEIENMGWDINRDELGLGIDSNSEYYVGQLPKGIKVTVNFTPLHNFVPRYGEAFIGWDSTNKSEIYTLPESGKTFWKPGEVKRNSGGVVLQ